MPMILFVSICIANVNIFVSNISNKACFKEPGKHHYGPGEHVDQEPGGVRHAGVGVLHGMIDKYLASYSVLNSIESF